MYFLLLVDVLCVFLVAAFLVMLASTILWYLSPMRSHLPPGPFGPPYLGCTMDFKSETMPHLILQKWRDKYGPIMSFYMGRELVVVLSDHTLLHEALTKEFTYSGRPPMLLPQPKKLVPNHGLVTMDGDLWIEQRRFAIRTMHGLVRRPAFREALHGAVRTLLERLQELADTNQLIDPHSLLSDFASTVICHVLFGQTFDGQEELRMQMRRLTYRNSGAQLHPLSMIFYFPWVMKLPVMRGELARFLREGEETAEFFQTLIDRCAETFDPAKEPDSYVHAFLKAKHANVGEYFTDAQLLPAVFQLFAGGTETVVSTLRFALFFMAGRQDVQKKCYQEARHGSWTEADWARPTAGYELPMARATLMEIMRLGCVLPLSVIHRTTQETTLRGFTIPANTRIIPFLYQVHRDPTYFPEPEKFCPHRFLNGDDVVKNPSWMPFCVGKRACLAEYMAKEELLTVFVALMREFRFRFEGDVAPPMDASLGFSLSLEPYSIYVQSRGGGDNDDDDDNNDHDVYT